MKQLYLLGQIHMQVTEHPNSGLNTTISFFILCKKKSFPVAVKGYYGNSTQSAGTQGLRPF